MNQRYVKFCTLVTAVFLLFAGCAVQGADVAGKIYMYEKTGCGGAFSIYIDADGTFSYYEGPLSSYIGNGNWKLDGGTLILQETISSRASQVNYFVVDGSDLLYQAEPSSNFLYVTVSDGERFSECPPEMSERIGRYRGYGI